MGVEVKVDRSRCIASKACINTAPGAFALDEVRIATVVDATAEPVKTLVEAAEACPTGAIAVYRDGQKLA